ncbi:hypothetical protein RUM44_008143 [Polyplax serrata]|uniref:RWD domain-containing protein n=1 Tax=Polyplax serrata TaxID=468196 RepID=A0ABR1BBG8_POLSC
MSNSELQEEEREVLLSIYEGDDRFKNISPTVYQYKYGEENDPKSFLLEISWTEDYPENKPVVNMNTFYNDHILTEIREKITNIVLNEAEQYLGAAMTYTLFEFVKEKEAELTSEILEKKSIIDDTAEKSLEKDQGLNQAKKEVLKKQQLTKAQKRREWDRMSTKGEKPRGWNWVDLVKHLSQTSSKSSTENSLETN